MKLTPRMVLSHVAVAVIALLAFYLVISLAVPALFDRGVAHGTPTGRGPGQGLRAVVSAAVTQAALLGGGIAAAAAVALGWFFSWRLVRPITQIRDATRRLSAGDYSVQVPLPPVQELADLAADVNSMGERLAQTERTRVQLIGDVAHEMRTPLTVIDGYVEGMIDGVIEVTPETLGELGTETRRLRRLAEDFSSLSRAEERRFDLRAEAVDLADLVIGAAERLRPQTEEKDVTLTVEVPPLPVVADPDRILQVVTNLVGNAIAATPSGGWIRVSGRREGDRALVDVADSGVGIAPGDVERVFERFFRAHPGRAGGSGIGLTISRELARAHGGDLAARSPGEGQGATFTLSLPLAP